MSEGEPSDDRTDKVLSEIKALFLSRSLCISAFLLLVGTVAAFLALYAYFLGLDDKSRDLSWITSLSRFLSAAAIVGVAASLIIQAEQFKSSVETAESRNQQLE